MESYFQGEISVITCTVPGAIILAGVNILVDVIIVVDANILMPVNALTLKYSWNKL